MTVSSNGVVNYDYYQIGPMARAAQPSRAHCHRRALNFEFPANPSVAAQPTDLPTEGTVAVMANGVQIFGPNEAPGTTVLTPTFMVSSTIAVVMSMSTINTLSQSASSITQPSAALPSLLTEGGAGMVLGYALDGFPILAPYECTDATRETILPVASSWDYDTSANWVIQNQGLSGDCATDDAGGYSDNYAWDCNVFNGQKADTANTLYADQCNGRTRRTVPTLTTQPAPSRIS